MDYFSPLWGKCVEIVEKTEGEYSVIQDQEQVNAFIKELKAHKKPIVVDIETTGLNARIDRILSCGIALGPKKAYTFACDHRDNSFLPKKTWMKLLQYCYDPPNGNQISAHNLSFDVSFAYQYGLTIGNWIMDTQYMAYQLDETVKAYSLAACAKRFLTGSKVEMNVKDMENVPLDIITARAGIDVLLQYQLLVKLYKELKLMAKDYEVDFALIKENFELVGKFLKICGEMRYNGICFDYDLNAKQIEYCADIIEKYAYNIDKGVKRAIKNFDGSIKVFDKKNNEFIEKSADEVFAKKFNPRSSLQKAVLFYDLFGFKCTRFTKSKLRSTNAKSIMELSVLAKGWKRQFFIYYMQYNRLQKLQSTYNIGFSKKAKQIGDAYFLFPSINLTSVETGRISISQPNTANIFRRDSLPEDMRSHAPKYCILPIKGYVWAGFDVSQSELRWIASMANDKKMIDIFNKGLDVHRETAKFMFNTDEPFDWQRTIAKTINFAIVYQGTWRTVMETLNEIYSEKPDLGTPPNREQIEEFISEFFRVYPEIKSWIDKTGKFVRKNGYVVSPFGRIRRPTSIYDDLEWKRDEAVRAAVNAPVQGSSDDYLKVIIIKMVEELFPKIEKKYGAKPILRMPLYDAIYMDIPEPNYMKSREHWTQTAEICKMVKDFMEKPHTDKLKVPFRMDYSYGPNWGDLELQKAMKK